MAGFTKAHMGTLMMTSFIGSGFGVGWWLYGATAVPGAAATMVRVAGIAILLGLVAWTMRLRRHGGDLPDPGATSGRNPFGKQYGIAVLLMVVAIFAGSRVLTAVLDKPEATATWILFCVGVHFIPFVQIFGSDRFLVMAVLECGVAVLAAALGFAGLTWAWAGVTGFGGAIVMWGTVVVALRAGSAEVTRQVTGSPL